MLKNLIAHRYNIMTDGQANIALLAQNQELRGIIARRKGNTAAAEVHEAAAQHFNALVYRTDFHSAPQNALLSFNPNPGTTAVNNLVLAARRKTKPAINLSSRVLGYQKEEVANALNNVVIDEFSPTPEQLAQCEADAAEAALAELLSRGRTFDQGTFDANIQEVYPIGEDGRLVVISKQDLATLTQRKFEECSARVMMENIVNKKISQAGNFAAFSVMHNAGHQIPWNERVTARMFWQEQFVALTAKGTGLSEANIRLVLENSVMNLNEQTPDEMIVSTAAQLVKTDQPIPTTLPPLEGNGKDGGVFETIPTTAVFMKTEKLVINPTDYNTDQKVEDLIFLLKEKGFVIRQTVNYIKNRGIKYKGKNVTFYAVQRLLKEVRILPQDVADTEAVEAAQPVPQDVADTEAVEAAQPVPQDVADTEAVEAEQPDFQDVADTEAVEAEQPDFQDVADTAGAEAAQPALQDVVDTAAVEAAQPDFQDVADTAGAEAKQPAQESATKKRTIRKYPRSSRQLRDYMNKRRR